MGLDNHGIRFLLEARSGGVSFDRVLTIGRQGLYVAPEPLASLLNRYGRPSAATSAGQMLTAENGYCEPVLRAMDAIEIDSLDNSDYEGASIIHDMNQPLPPHLHGRFTAVIDSGSLEHIFNFPAAIRNCMEAVAPGGAFLAITPANNFMGHGFYQFSPELFFRILSPENGFRIVKLMIYETGSDSPWYDVVDPETIHGRVQLINTKPAQMLIWAQRTAVVPIFAQTPQQSDYSAMWSQQAGRTITVAENVAAPPQSLLKRYMPPSLARLYYLLFPFRPRLFRKVAG